MTSTASQVVSVLTGKWRIVEMEMWDQEAVDLVGPGYIEFHEAGWGELRFIAVEGRIGCRFKQSGGRPCVDFTWEGSDDCDPVEGTGYAILRKNGRLSGRISIRDGDNSTFVAERFVGPGSVATIPPARMASKWR